MNLNFHAGRELAHAFVDGMRERGFGRIVNLTGSDEPMALNGGVPPNGAVHLWAKGLSRVVGGDGPCNRERLGARVKAWDDGAWVREAALAHARKQASKQEAA